MSHQMPFVILLLLLASFVSGQSLLGGIVNSATKLLSYENNNFGHEGYNFKYVTDDRTYREERGRFVEGIWTVIGLYSWVSPEDNKRHTVRYVADHNGYRAMESDDLPGPKTRTGLSKAALSSLAG